MLTCYSLTNRFKRRLLFIFVSVLIIRYDGINSLSTSTETDFCPFIETSSFGSDIDIKCNNTYLIFSEINNKRLKWKFADQSSYCDQKGTQQGFVNQCNITRIDSKYLTVPLKSLDYNENACVYCVINYKLIAPIIRVTQFQHQDIVYTFNLTATGLNDNESFEILWAKRSNHHLRYSSNYWFLPKCIHHDISIIEDTGHSIIFDVEEAYIFRVEFIIRRCNGTCRAYRTCGDEEFSAETSLNHFQAPDSIEKISCNSACLNGIISTTTTATTTTTMNNIIKEDILVSTIQLSNKKQIIKFSILYPILSLLIVLLLIILGCFIISRIKGLRTDNMYTKTSHINLDENKEIFA